MLILSFVVKIQIVYSASAVLVCMSNHITQDQRSKIGQTFQFKTFKIQHAEIGQ